MTLEPAKHEKVAQMGGFRMFLGFREHEMRRSPCVEKG